MKCEKFDLLIRVQGQRGDFFFGMQLEFASCGPVSVLESPLHRELRLRLNALYPSMARLELPSPTIQVLFGSPSTRAQGPKSATA